MQLKWFKKEVHSQLNVANALSCRKLYCRNIVLVYVYNICLLTTCILDKQIPLLSHFSLHEKVFSVQYVLAKLELLNPDLDPDLYDQKFTLRQLTFGKTRFL
jgi:hypothetical protein